MSETVTVEETIERLELFGRTGAWTGFREDILTLVDYIAGLQVEAREKNAWEGRYNALLEEAEASRPPEIDDDGHDLPQEADGVFSHWCSP